MRVELCRNGLLFARAFSGAEYFICVWNFVATDFYSRAHFQARNSCVTRVVNSAALA